MGFYPAGAPINQATDPVRGGIGGEGTHSALFIGADNQQRVGVRQGRNRETAIYVRRR